MTVVQLPDGITAEQKTATVSSGSTTESDTWVGSYDTTRSLCWMSGVNGMHGRGASANTNDLKDLLLAVTSFSSSGFTLTRSNTAITTTAELTPMQFPILNTFRQQIIIFM